MSIHDCFDWYSLLRTQALTFGMPFQPFDGIELVYTEWGLCLHGIALLRFRECGGLLMQILEQVLPMSEPRIAGIADIIRLLTVDGAGGNSYPSATLATRLPKFTVGKCGTLSPSPTSSRAVNSSNNQTGVNGMPLN